jgi:hypothetical protein
MDTNVDKTSKAWHDDFLSLSLPMASPFSQTIKKIQYLTIEFRIQH